MYGAVTLYGAPFQSASTRHRLGDSLERLPSSRVGPTTPSQHRRQAVPLRRFRLFPLRSPLLRESRLLSLPRGTEMFQFPRCPPPALCVQTGVPGHDPRRVSPFGYPRINAWSAAPRGFSQPPTSFIGIWRQGIHRWLFVAWDFSSFFCSLLDARAHSSVLNPRARSTGDLGQRSTSSCTEARTVTAGRNTDAHRPEGRRRGRAPSKRNSE